MRLQPKKGKGMWMRNMPLTNTRTDTQTKSLIRSDTLVRVVGGGKRIIIHRPLNHCQVSLTAPKHRPELSFNIVQMTISGRYTGSTSKCDERSVQLLRARAHHHSKCNMCIPSHVPELPLLEPVQPATNNKMHLSSHRRERQRSRRNRGACSHPLFFFVQVFRVLKKRFSSVRCTCAQSWSL